MKFLVFLVSLSLLCGPAYAKTECKVPRAVESPCSGVLLPPEAAAEGLKCLQVEVPKLKLELDYKDSLMSNQKTHFDELMSLEKSRGDRLQTQLDSVTDKVDAWYNNPYFLMGVGFFVGSAMTVGIAHSLSPAYR